MTVAARAGHPGSGELLRKAGIEHADSLLIVGLHDYQDTEADIQVLHAPLYLNWSVVNWSEQDVCFQLNTIHLLLPVACYRRGFTMGTCTDIRMFFLYGLSALF